MSKYIIYNGDLDTKLQKPHVVTISPVLDQIKAYYFNSIEYNSRYIEPHILDQIAYVNEVIEQTLSDPIEAFDEMAKVVAKTNDKDADTIRTIFLPANNSIH